MTRTRLTRQVAGSTVALTLLAGMFTATALAKPPDYEPKPPDTILVGTPATVSHGGQVRFDVWFRNTSGANLPTVNMSAATSTGAALIRVIPIDGVSPSQGTCDDSQKPALLTCAFGTVNAGAEVRVSVIYQVPGSGSSYSQQFTFTAQGSTPNDNPKKSRGDDMPVIARVALSNDPELASSYISDGNESVANQQALNKQRNPQSATLNFDVAPGDPGFAASVHEQPPGFRNCPTTISSCFGNWNDVAVNQGAPVAGGYEAVFGYFQIPGNASTVKFVHLLNNATNPSIPNVDYELITDACTYDAGGNATNLPCISNIRVVMGNTFYTLLFPGDTNGPMRGY